MNFVIKICLSMYVLQFLKTTKKKALKFISAYSLHLTLYKCIKTATNNKQIFLSQLIIFALFNWSVLFNYSVFALTV